MSSLRRPSLASALAATHANARYWTTIAPQVARELTRWRGRALAMPDARLRALALSKLREERFNSEVAATVAVVAPAPLRRSVIGAVVALQVAYDYLDLLTELPMAADARRRALRALVQAARPVGDERPRELDVGEDGGYLAALVRTTKRELDALPAADAVRAVAERRAELCALAQARRHTEQQGRGAATAALAAAPVPATGWPAQAAAPVPATGWLDGLSLAAEAGSVLCLHALLAAAAGQSTTVEEARRLDRLYLEIAALTVLDGVVDADDDPASVAASGGEAAAVADLLTAIAARVHERARGVAHTSHHRLTLTGVIAYYASAHAERAGREAASARGADAGSSPGTAGRGAADGGAIARLERGLAPQLTPALWTMRAWRAVKRRRLVSSGAVGAAHLVPRFRVSGSVGAPPGGVDLLTPLETRRWWRE